MLVHLVAIMHVQWIYIILSKAVVLTMVQHMQLNMVTNALVRFIKELCLTGDQVKKVHLIGHSMGGQTVRLMEELLRNGSKDEIAYHQKHGGTISPLLKEGSLIWFHQ